MYSQEDPQSTLTLAIASAVAQPISYACVIVSAWVMWPAERRLDTGLEPALKVRSKGPELCDLRPKRESLSA